jgi:thiamine pyrophosphokinase
MTERPRTARHVLLLADGDAPSRAELEAAWPGWDEGLGWVVAADGGARLAAGLGLAIDEWVGDGDSLGAAGLADLRAMGVPVELAAAEKEASDAELGVIAATRVPGVAKVTILGALGGPRFDHAVANLFLLGHPAARGLELSILDAGARVRLIEAPGHNGVEVRLGLAGRPGDLVSLLPLGEVAGVTTTGLRYPLAGGDLHAGPARGLSNVREAAAAEVVVRRGRLLVIEVPATLPE